MRLIPILILVLCHFPAAFADGSLPVVENPREAPRTSVVEYEEVWRAGADDSEEFLFGVIRDAVTDEDGNIYLLDSQQQQVFKFSADGRISWLGQPQG